MAMQTTPRCPTCGTTIDSTDCGKGWRGPEEYARLEAACAEMRAIIQDVSDRGMPSCAEAMNRSKLNEDQHASGCRLHRVLSTNPGQPLLDRLERCRKALEFYADKSKWMEIRAVQKLEFPNGGQVLEDEPLMAFSDGEDRPWGIAVQALKEP